MIKCPGCCIDFSSDDFLKHAVSEHPMMDLQTLQRAMNPESRAKELEAQAEALQKQAADALAEAARLRGG